MKKIGSLLALAGLFLTCKLSAISLDDIQLWAGSGTNRAALVIDWNSPLVFNNTSVPAPVTTKTMVWGYRFNGTSTGTQMLEAVLAADPRLYVTIQQFTFGPFTENFVEGIGYNFSGSGSYGLTDGVSSYTAADFTNGILWNSNLDPDGSHPTNGGDLFWSGLGGPTWNTWNELNDNGGFLASPNRGSSPYWDTNTLNHGEWSFAENGLDFLPLTNGSWIGFSVAAAGYDTNTADAATAAFNNDEQAPPSPDGTYVAYVCNTNDFAVQIISTNNLDPVSPYNNPAAILNRPTLNFFDPFDGSVTDRVSIIDDPFNTAPDGSDVITEIKSGGQITVKLGRKIYDDPNNPYGIDLMVYGNSFFSAFNTSGFVSDATDLNVATLSTGIFGHPTVVSVSQDGVNWYTYGATSVLFPDNAWRWDDANDSWTDEQMNPNKPLNPYIATNNFGGQTVASGLDQFMGAAGGTGYDLKASGYPWIQYVRIQPGAGTYTVIDAIAAANPVPVGDALSITPDNLAGGITNLAFQKPDGSGKTLISVNFAAVNAGAKVSTVSVADLSPFAPVIGIVSSAYQITLKPLAATNTVSYAANLGLRVADNYSGNGADLRAYQWCGNNWAAQSFTYNPANHQVALTGVTNFSAFVVSQIVPPQLAVQVGTNATAFQFAPVPNCTNILERSTDLITWTPVATNAPGGGQSATLQDTNAPTDHAYYRLRVEIP